MQFPRLSYFTDRQAGAVFGGSLKRQPALHRRSFASPGHNYRCMCKACEVQRNGCQKVKAGSGLSGDGSTEMPEFPLNCCVQSPGTHRNSQVVTEACCLHSTQVTPVREHSEAANHPGGKKYMTAHRPREPRPAGKSATVEEAARVDDAQKSAQRSKALEILAQPQLEGDPLAQLKFSDAFWTVRTELPSPKNSYERTN